MNNDQRPASDTACRGRWRCTMFLLRILSVAALAAGSPAAVHAHGAGHMIVDRPLESGGTAVEFVTGNGEPVANAAFQVFGPGDATPFQSGRTDALGRAAFVADRPGDWRIDLTDANGHGASASITIGADRTVAAGASWRRWLLRASLLGNLILAAFAVQLLLDRRHKPSEGPAAP